MWNSGWNKIFLENEWGCYPALEVVRYIARNFYKVSDRCSLKILEIGCGTGANLWFIAREGFKAYGIDGSNVAIDRAKSRFIKDGLKAEFSIADAMQLPFNNNVFDCVIDFECIYANSVRDSLIIMNEINRVLKPGGKFLSITFSTGTFGDGKGINLDGENNTYIKLNEGAFHDEYGIVRFTSEEEIGNMYGSIFEIMGVDYTIRSENNRSYIIKEWVIQCKKPFI